MTDTDDTPKYDVAISFLAADGGIAAELNNLLSDSMNVFFFPRKQEELAGTNGLESMREPFLKSRVAVVLYRAPWGNTNWTRVEQAAITDRFLTEGWDWLLFVQLDESELPAWLPKTHVRFAIEQYGLAQLAGAVKFRVQERGGKIEAPTVLSKAQRVAREAELIAEQKSLFRNEAWIRSNFQQDVKRLMEKIAALTDEIKAKTTMPLVACCTAEQCILRDPRISLNVGLRQEYVNAISDAEIISAEFNGHLFLPHEGMMTMFRPTELRRVHYKPTLLPSREIGWIDVDENGGAITTEKLAEKIVTQFLDLASRANKGEIEFAFL